MKLIIASLGALFVGLFASTTLHADTCTNKAFNMGWDAAKQACDDIITGWIPLAIERHVSGYAAGLAMHEPIPEPERTCTLAQVVECKNAMAQYLRSNEGQACGNLVRENAKLSARASGSSDQAYTVWRGYVTNTCNMR